MQPFISEERLQVLAKKWLDRTITKEEMKEFAEWYHLHGDSEIVIPSTFAKDDDELEGRIYHTIDHHIASKQYSLKRPVLNWYAAAGIVIMLSTALYFYSGGKKSDIVASKKPVPQLSSNEYLNKRYVAKAIEEEFRTVRDIPAGKDKAVLTLTDGTRIILDDMQNGIVASQGGSSILKAAHGELIYSFLSEESPSGNEQVGFNTIETPKGGKFQVKLPDGSKVWLNAASSLRFPASFEGPKRQVELTGEAYFEIAPDQNRIFEVITRGQTVQVLGTHFNINAYADEPSVNTSLLEGIVRISDMRTKASQLLKPGEQAKLKEKIEIVKLKNIEDAIAWKDGYFQFEDSDIETVMRQIGRWYDVSVRYEEENIPVQRFGGEIQRSLSLLEVLEILEQSNVKFQLEGRELTVMK